ncbi:hypothetical protein LI90_2834 [Carbonactinospora thermoautotrophica]|uniref:Uncharacterized protein n=1 Tax=Carbonactinospora thermoautotrophica TaxID=1469144 RepID=A0A132MWR6_9ACTN|nr:hypothetical protein LI90_2834 [Carbonactinospora thermoautotrophica]
MSVTENVPRTPPASDRSTAPQAPPARVGVAVIGLLLAAALGLAVHAVGGPRMAVLYGIGLTFGVVLFHSRFGFTSAWRQLVAVGQGAALRAHMVMLGVACLLFAPLLATGTSLAGAPQPTVAPIGVSLLVGAFVFGVGMQLGGACASGTLFAVGSGQTSILITLAGFIAGSVLGAWHFTFWTHDVPTGPAVSLAQTLGYAGALAVSLLVMALVYALTLLIARRRRPPEIEQPPRARGLARVIRGSWPLWVGAVALAVLNALTLFVSGKPWGITSAFVLWGSKLLAAVGVDVSRWAYWSTPDRAAALHASVLADRTSVMDFGIVLGALVASAASGTFVLHRRVPWKLALGALLGGILMGYGARLAYGCNIGAYFSGIASFSLHGWIWGLLAIAGTYVGLALRPFFGLTNPKPTDSVC